MWSAVVANGRAAPEAQLAATAVAFNYEALRSLELRTEATRLAGNAAMVARSEAKMDRAVGRRLPTNAARPATAALGRPGHRQSSPRERWFTDGIFGAADVGDYSPPVLRL
jgi:hypothetical protein